MPAAQPKPHWKQCAAFLFSFVFLALRLGAMEDARPAGDGEATPTPLRVTAVAQKERFSLLEPVVLRVEVENPGADVAHLPNAWSADRRIFDLTARRLDGDGGPARPRSTTLAEAAKRTPIIITGNGSSVRSIPAGERIVGDARANLYCDMTVPGEYEINVEVVHYARPPLGPNGADETLNPPRVDRARPVRVVVDPEVAPEEPAPSGDRGATSAVGDKMIEVELATTKASFVQSEPIPIRVTISNIGEQPIEIPRSPRPFGLTARFLSDGIVWAPPKTLDCPATTAASRDPSSDAPRLDEETVEIAPGGQVVHSLLANLVRDMSRAGNYTVEVALPYRDATAKRGDGEPAAPRMIRSRRHRLTVHDPIREQAAARGGLSGQGIGGGGRGIGGGGAYP